MYLYILRHGIAYDREEWQGDDAARPLTDKGKERTQAVVKALLKKKLLRVDAIWSSPLARALQTAEIAGKALGLPVTAVDALACGASVQGLMAAFRKLEPLPARLMLVGHEPDCGAIVAELVGDETRDYALKKAGVAALEGEFRPRGMVLQWKLGPKDVLKERDDR